MRARPPAACGGARVPAAHKALRPRKPPAAKIIFLVQNLFFALLWGKVMV